MNVECSVGVTDENDQVSEGKRSFLEFHRKIRKNNKLERLLLKKKSNSEILEKNVVPSLSQRKKLSAWRASVFRAALKVGKVRHG